MVKRALDTGAHGIVVPLLYTAEDARTLVQNSKFPPLGRRGYGSPFSMGSFAVQGGTERTGVPAERDRQPPDNCAN
jgi:4-hydroxy-2-oxoheptanedioate aldolase